MADYLSYLMGATGITDQELESLGVEILGRSESGNRKLKVPFSSLADYEQLIIEKLDAGFWNDLVSEDEIIFIFKLKDGTIKRLVRSDDNQQEIAKLCSELNGDPVARTSLLLAYLAANPLYKETIWKYYFKHLSRKWASAAGLFFNKQGELLIVKPTYKEGWSIVGGNVEEHDTPLETFRREVKEEIGLTISSETPLLCVAYGISKDIVGDSVEFLFDGGVLSDEQIEDIVLPEGELSEYKFVPIERALSMFGNLLASQVRNSLVAKKEGRAVYIENKA